MSSTDVTDAAPAPAETVRRRDQPASVRADLRLFRQRAADHLLPRRNQLLLLVAALFPLLIGIGLKVAAPQGGGGGGRGPPGRRAARRTSASSRATACSSRFVALSLLLILVLPMVVAVVAGDSVAGEAGYGTLRYLLAVPAGRTRLLAVKYAAIVVWAVAATFVVSVVALVTGRGAVRRRPGDAAVGHDRVAGRRPGARAVGDVVRVRGDGGARRDRPGDLDVHRARDRCDRGGASCIVVASEVVDNIPQFAPVAPYLPTQWWLSFDSLLRTPVDTTTLWHGLLSFFVYAAIFAGDRLGPLHLSRRHQLILTPPARTSP